MGQTGSVPSLSNLLIRLELKLVKIASRVRLSLASVPRFPLRAHSPDPQAAESCGGISEEARAAVRKALVRPHVFWSLEVRLSRVSLIGRDESLLQTESQVPTVMRAWVRNHSLAAPPQLVQMEILLVKYLSYEHAAGYRRSAFRSKIRLELSEIFWLKLKVYMRSTFAAREHNGHTRRTRIAALTHECSPVHCKSDAPTKQNISFVEHPFGNKVTQRHFSGGLSHRRRRR